jgi:hypothetical protein
MIRKLATVSLLAAVMLMPATAASAAPLDVSGNAPTFINPDDLSIGDSAVVGDTFDYEGILVEGGVTVDAHFTVLSVDGLIGIFDAAEFPDSSPWSLLFSQLRFQEDEIGGGKVRYLVEFTNSATGDPVELSGLSFSVRDVDETQYVQASDLKSFSLSSSPATELSVVTPNDDASVVEGEIRFESPSIGVDPSDEEYWATLTLEDVSSFTLELGQGDYDFEEWAYYYLDFAIQDWTNSPTETDASSLAESDDLAATGTLSSLVPMVAVAAFGLLSIGVALRRRRS